MKKATPRRARRRAGEPLDVEALLQRVTQVIRAAGAAEAGVFVPESLGLVRTGADLVPGSPRGRAWLSALLRGGVSVRAADEAVFFGESAPTFLAVPDGSRRVLVYAAGKPDGFTDEDEALVASVARLVVASLAQPGPEEMAAPAELVSVISHELKNPLASIRGFGVLLRDHLETLSEDERQEFVAAILRQTDNLSNLIGDVLDLSQMIAGRFHYAATSFDPCELIEECLADMRAAYPTHRMVFGGGDLPQVRLDRDRVKQVLANLLSNACRYSSEGSLVPVSARSDAERLVIDVSDEGVGIAAEDMPRLFGRFERLHRAALPNVKGTGLGLYIAKQIVEAHGGAIGVESTPGRGSTFTVVFPLLAQFA